jgi:hypothetical protein
MTTYPAAHITSLDHLVLTISSIPTSQKWYETNLRMKLETFVSAATPSISRYSLIFGTQKINLHQQGKVRISVLVRVSYGGLERERDSTSLDLRADGYIGI